MKILLFGVSNVGKSTVGELLAKRLGYAYYDLDDEVKMRLGMTLEDFVHGTDLQWRDQKRGSIIKKILQSEENLVLAVTPITYTNNFKTRIIADDILLLELYDTPENIFSRLIFSDENDNIYKDDIYKNVHKDHYLREIQADMDWYGNIYSDLGIENRIFMNNEPPETVVDEIIEKYCQKSK